MKAANNRLNNVEKRIETHEAVCAERYATIVTSLSNITKRLEEVSTENNDNAVKSAVSQNTFKTIVWTLTVTGGFIGGLITAIYYLKDIIH